MIKRFTFDGGGPSDAARRVVMCTLLRELTPDAPYDQILVEWFDEVPPSPSGASVIAHEHVLRGAGWLAQRWIDGGPRLKHMALAGRAPGLTSAEFSERWRNHAGSVGPTPIPDVAKGQAYAQNHPTPGDWAHDAVAEVWFDDLADLRTRVEFFAAQDPGAANDLVGAHCFIAVREELL